MAIAINSSNIVQTNADGGPFTTSFTAGAGSIIHVYLMTDSSPTTASISDNISGSYTQLDRVLDPTYQDIYVSQYYVANVTSGTRTITATFTGTAPFACYFVVLEITGAAASPLDGHNNFYNNLNITTGNGTVSGTATNTNPNALIIGACEMNTNNANISAGTNYTSVISSFTITTPVFVEQQIVNGINPWKALFTSNTGDFCVALIVIYDQAGPVINTEPTNQKCYAGQTTTFSVTATTSGGSLSYQWKKNGVNVGSNSSTYTTAATVNTDNNSSVYCVVTDNNGTNNTVTVYLQVVPAGNLDWIT